MDDDLILSNKKEGVLITKTVAHFGNVSYPIGSIGAVWTTKDSPRLAYLGCLVLLVDLITYLNTLNIPKYTDKTQFVYWAIGGAAMILIGLRMSGAKLMLRTASGNQQAIWTRNVAFVQELKTAIETAVTKRG